MSFKKDLSIVSVCSREICIFLKSSKTVKLCNKIQNMNDRLLF